MWAPNRAEPGQQSGPPGDGPDPHATQSLMFLPLRVFAAPALVLATMLPVAACAQAPMRPCPETGVKHECWGEVTLGENARYSGEFRHGKRDGLGIYVYPSGARYVGGWRRGERDGEGIEYRSNGTVWTSGTWAEGITVRTHPVDTARFPFSLSRTNKQELLEAEAKRLLSSEFSVPALARLPWRERLEQGVNNILRRWLSPEARGLEEIPPPTYPAALALRQEPWESDREFETRVEAARNQRKRLIDQVEAEYRAKVDARNLRVAQYNETRQEREKQRAEKRRELTLAGLAIVAPAISLSLEGYDQQSNVLTLAAQVEGLGRRAFAFGETPQAFRREAMTSPAGLRAVPDFPVTDAGDILLAAVTVEAAGARMRGVPASGNPPPLRPASAQLAPPEPPAYIAQTSVSVDRNQVEQILYRDENEMLRKRLEEQRLRQEQAVAAADARAAQETARLRAEAQALRQRLESGEGRKPPMAMAGLKAHALVIGNSAYEGNNRLANPAHDARAMAAKLRSLGFEVTQVLDTSRTELVSALSRFSQSASRADLTLLFYAGHGAQISGTNYMIPVDIRMADISQAGLQAVSLNSVIENYLPGKTKLVFLDACRDNPLMASGLRGISKGLAPISVSEGTLIAYATKDGQTAEDGVGQANSPFTAALLEHLGEPLDIAVILRRVREKVMQRTAGRQQPWEYGSLTGGELVLSAIKP